MLKTRKDNRISMRLDEDLRQKLQQLSECFGEDTSEVLRQIIRQASLRDFPKSWQMRFKEQQQASGHECE